MQSLGMKLYEALICKHRYILILSGLGRTLLIAFLATIIGCFLGLVIALTKEYSKNNKSAKILNVFFDIYLIAIRGTPVLIQLLIMYNIIFVSATSKSSILLVAVISFGINSSAYVSEIVRSGISSIDKGQFEAGIALGLNKNKVMLLIVLPQAIKNILPALFNEFIALVKETSVAGYIGVEDLTRVSDIIKSVTYEPIGPLMITAVIYLVIVGGLTSLLKYFERRFNKSGIY